MSAAPVLKILKDGETIKTCPLEEEAVVGRAEGCVIRLEDRAISRQHALFRRVGDGIQVEKKSEFAPLIVNGAECTRAVLKEGDVISIGPYLIKLAAGQEGPRPVEKKAEPAAALSLVAPELTPDETQINPEGAGVETAVLEAPVLAPADEDLIPLNPALEATTPNPTGHEPTPELSVQSESPSGASDFNISLEGAAGVPIEQPIEVQTPSSAAIATEESSQDVPVMEDAATKALPSGKVNATLRFREGEANVTEFGISKDEVVIGRGKDCDIVLNDKKASRKNAVILRSGARFILKDLESSNGTYLNGKKLGGEAFLGGAEQIRIGDVEFEFNAGEADYEQRKQNFLPTPSVEEELGEVFHTNDIIPPSAVDPVAAAHQQAEFIPAATPENLIGIAGLNPGASAKKGTLLEKFRALPKTRQYIVGACVLAILYFAFIDDDEQPAPVKAKPKVAQVAPTGAASKDGNLPAFAALTPEQKKFVESQHEIAFSYYKNRDYDKAIFEIEKIFSLVSDYKDSREIERYAKEGKRKLEALADEKRKQEEEAALKKRIADLIADGRDKMDKKKFDDAAQVFSQILALDPENAQVAAWQKQIQDLQEEKQIEAQKHEVANEVNAQAWGVYRQGLALKRAGKFKTAIAVFEKVKEINAGDGRPARLAEKMIHKCHELIYAQYKPLLDEGKQDEDNGEYLKALELYEKALGLDPISRATMESIARVKGVLHDRAKALYTEAVLAESYSDFSTARKKFKDCLETAPRDDIYHARAERKLARYFKTDIGNGT